MLFCRKLCRKCFEEQALVDIPDEAYIQLVQVHLETFIVQALNNYSYYRCSDFDLVPLFGRLDSKDCSVQTDAQFPNPTMTYSVMMDYFKKQLNMTDPEVHFGPFNNYKLLIIICKCTELQFPIRSHFFKLYYKCFDLYFDQAWCGVRYPYAPL